MFGFVKTEFIKWLRDPLSKFMLFYPLLFGLLGRYGVPWIAETSGRFQVDAYADIIVVILTLLIPQVYGALIGFSILDDRDDHILTSIRVTPLSIHLFLSFRLALAFILSFAACAFVIGFSAIGGLSASNIIIIALLSACLAPVTGLIVNALAHNKIEGFAVMKGAGTLILFPIIALFFVDVKELFFALAPGFWPAKAISSVIRGSSILYLSYAQYVVYGFLYVLLLNFILYRVFLRKIKV